MKVTYKGRRSFGSSMVEIDFDEKETSKVKALVSIMNAKGWKRMKFDTICINGIETSWVFCPVSDYDEYKNYFMPDWKESKLELTTAQN